MPVRSRDTVGELCLPRGVDLFDATDIQSVRVMCRRRVECRPCEFLLLDLSETEVFGAAFMGALLLTRQELAVRDCSLLLSRLNQRCSDLLEIVGLGDLFQPPVWLAMIFELRTHRVILDELSSCYGMFRFTGGDVPRRPWSLVAVTSYFDRPFPADGISTGAAQRYRDLAEAIMALGDAVAVGRPRSLRSRNDIAETFASASSEIRALGGTLEEAMTEVSGEPVAWGPSQVPLA